MGFPSVVGTPVGTADTSSASFTVALPAGIVAGELLLIFIAHDGVGTITQSSGPTFTKIDTAVNGTLVQGEIWGRIATGGEGSPVFASTNSQDVACVSARVQNHGVTDIATDITKGTAATGADASPNPPNCNPGTVQDFLWLEFFAADDDDDTATYWSTGYSAVLQQQSASSTSSCLVAVASLQSNASSENPGVMAMAAVEEWVAQTIAIKPITEKTHTTNSLLKAALDKTHATDSLLKATLDKTHTTDSLLKAALTKDHTTDSFIAAGGVDISHTTDSLLKSTGAKTHATDSLLKATLDKTHTTDSLLKAASDKTHATDSLLKATLGIGHQTDSLMSGAVNAVHSTDSLVKAALGKTHTTDSLLKSTVAKTHATDSLLKATLGIGHQTDSLMSGAVNAVHSTDSLVKAALGKTHTTDSLLKSTVAKTHATDSLITGTVNAVHTTDSYVAGLVEKQHSTNSLLKKSSAVAHATDSFLQPPAGENVNVQVVVADVVKAGALQAFSIAITDWIFFADADVDPTCIVYQATGAGPFVVYDAPVITNRPGATGIYDGQFTTSAIAAGGAPVLYMISIEVKLGSSQKIWSEVIMAIGPSA